MSFLIRTLGRTVISTAVSAAVTFAIKRAVDSRSERKPPRPRLPDGRRAATKVKSPSE